MQSLSARQNSYAGNTIARRYAAAVWMNDTGDAQHNGGDDMMSWLTKYKVSPSYFQPAYAGRGFIIQISIGNDLIHRQLCACIILIWTSGKKFKYSAIFFSIFSWDIQIIILSFLATSLINRFEKIVQKRGVLRPILNLKLGGKIVYTPKKLKLNRYSGY